MVIKQLLAGGLDPVLILIEPAVSLPLSEAVPPVPTAGPIDCPGLDPVTRICLFKVKLPARLQSLELISGRPIRPPNEDAPVTLKIPPD